MQRPRQTLDLVSWSKIWMLVVPRATTYPTIFSQRYKPKVLITRTLFTPRNLKIKIQSQFYHVAIRWNQLRKKIKKRGSKGIGKRRVNKFWLLVLILLIPQKKKKRYDVSKIMCFHYNKKGYYFGNWTKQKN